MRKSEKREIFSEKRAQLNKKKKSARGLETDTPVHPKISNNNHNLRVVNMPYRIDLFLNSRFLLEDFGLSEQEDRERAAQRGASAQFFDPDATLRFYLNL